MASTDKSGESEDLTTSQVQKSTSPSECTFAMHEGPYQHQSDSDSDRRGSVENTKDTDVQLGINPWPYLGNYFTFIKASQANEKSDLTIQYKCILCTPTKLIKVNSRSRFNLIRHIRVTHPGQSKAFGKLLGENTKKRGRPGHLQTSSSSSQELERQTSVDTFLGLSSSRGVILPQSKVINLTFSQLEVIFMT